MERPGFEADRQRIVLRALAGRSDARADRRPGTALRTGSPGRGDGKALLATAHDLGNTALFAVDAGTGQARTLVEKGTAKAAAAAGGRAVFTHETLTRPGGDRLRGLDGADFRRPHGA